MELSKRQLRQHPRAFVLNHKRYQVVDVTSSAADAKRSRGRKEFNEYDCKVKLNRPFGVWLVGIR